MQLIPVDDRKTKPMPPSQPGTDHPASERRRVARVVHDDRGSASVEWVDAPSDFERVALSLEDSRPAPKPGAGYNPYDREAGARQPPGGAIKDKSPARRDLRKLSEWIKQMRELEERKRRGDTDEEA